MATENVEILVDDKGSAEKVRRNIDEIGTASDKTSEHVGSLNRGLSGLSPGPLGAEFQSLSQSLGGTFSNALGGATTGLEAHATASGKVTAALQGQAGIMTATAQASTQAATAHSAQAGAASGLRGVLSNLTTSLRDNYKAEFDRLSAVNATIPSLATLAAATKEAERETGLHGRAAAAAGGELHAMEGGVRTLERAIRTLITLELGKVLLEAAEGSRALNESLTHTLRGSEGVADSFQKVYEVSQRTHTALGDNVAMFGAMSDIFRGQFRDVSAVLPIMETYNQTVMLSGLSGQQATRAQQALTQAMAQGGFNQAKLIDLYNLSKISVDSLAFGLGTNTRELYKMADAGLVSTNDIIRGFRNAGAQVAAASKDFVPTIAQAWTTLQNSLVAYVNRTGEAEAATGLISKALDFLANNMGVVVPVAIALTGAMAILLALQVAQWAYAVGAGFVKMAATMIEAAGAAAATGLALAIANPLLTVTIGLVLALAGYALYMSGSLGKAKDAITTWIKEMTEATGHVGSHVEANKALDVILQRNTGTLLDHNKAINQIDKSTGNFAKTKGSEAEAIQNATASTRQNIGEMRSLDDVLKGTTQRIQLASGEWKTFQGDAHTAAVEAFKDWNDFTNKFLKLSEEMAEARKKAFGYYGDNRDLPSGYNADTGNKQGLVPTSQFVQGHGYVPMDFDPLKGYSPAETYDRGFSSQSIAEQLGASNTFGSITPKQSGSIDFDADTMKPDFGINNDIMGKGTGIDNLRRSLGWTEEQIQANHVKKSAFGAPQPDASTGPTTINTNSNNTTLQINLGDGASNDLSKISKLGRSEKQQLQRLAGQLLQAAS
jgi:tape measure domain-containing protein